MSVAYPVAADTGTASITDMSTKVDKPTPCVYVEKNSKCSVPAEWALLMSCCGNVVTVCQKHFDKILDDAKFIDGYTCAKCMVTHRPPLTAILAANRLDKR